MTDDSKTVLTVDPKVSYIVAQVESAGFGGAIRFEPSVYEHIKGCTLPEKDVTTESTLVQHIAKINSCTIETAELIYSMSFGLYLIM